MTRGFSPLSWTLGAFAGATLVGYGCGGGGTNYVLPVSDDGDGGTFVGGDAGGSAPFDAYIEANRVAVKLVTLSCSGDCATVQAVGTGGYPPYAFVWENGSTAPQREVCPTSDTTYSVKVSDTGSTGEVPRPSESVKVPLTADVLASCPDGGGPVSIPDASASCGAADGAAPLDTITPDIDDNNETYFAGGASLPAGRYAIRYVGGCVNYSACCGTWTVNGQDGQDEYLIVGATTADRIAIAPGSFAIVLTPGAAPAQRFTDPADCVAANLADAPYVFEFAGGKLGIYNNDFEPADNAAGMGVGAPSFSLTACP